MRLKPTCALCITAVTLAALPTDGLTAQTGSVDFSVARWWRQGPGVATIYSGTYRTRLLGPSWWGLAAVHTKDDGALVDMTTSGGEASLALGLPQRGPYALGTVGVGFRHGSSDFGANWSVGAGYTLHLVSVLRLGAEVRYRADDPGFRGFWRLDSVNRRGWMLQASLGFGFGSNGRNAPLPSTTITPSAAALPPPTAVDVNASAITAGASEEGAALTSGVVQTAIAQMGTPYVWGGTDSNGFDCSGLIQYAYAQHGIILPRVSRDQVRTGKQVGAKSDLLRPGDILGFAVEGSRVSHVGLYVGEGRFIHSSSGGVKLSSLTASEPESRWWQDRFVAARRIVD